MTAKTPGYPRALPCIPGAILYVILVLASLFTEATGNGTYAYLNQTANSSLVLLQKTLDFTQPNFRTAFSFRTCSGGKLLNQNGQNGDFFSLLLSNRTLQVHWRSGGSENVLNITSSVLNVNEWYFLDLVKILGNLKLIVNNGGQEIVNYIVANSTFRTSIFNVDLSGSSGLNIGVDYSGCLMEGPGLHFRNSNGEIRAVNVLWDNTDCPVRNFVCNSDGDDIDDCYSHPCQNNGKCIDGFHNYTCQCPHLFNGTNCENSLSIYGCDVHPCLNNGTCKQVTSGDRNYKCECVPGFTNVNCELNIDECASEPKPCAHGRCIDGINNFTCDCSGTGYSGSHCSIEINECNLDPSICGNGTCYNNPGSFTCECPRGYQGDHCQQDIDECLSLPCHNGGTCHNLINNYTCTCVTGYTGRQCNTNIDDCVSITCPGSHSTCKDGVSTYQCVCDDGFTGTPPNCQDINECLSNPCQNGATCRNLENHYQCDCIPGYNGTNCENNIDDCAPSPCLNGATCEDGVGTYTCNCLTGFEGRNCNTNIDDCANRPCKNGATCNDQINNYNCTCLPGWTGPTCVVNINECFPNPCRNGATCSDFVNYYNCSCVAGYTGINCETDIDDCATNPCYNNGTCHDKVNGYECECPIGKWMGKTCAEVYNACFFTPCQNGATCATIPPSLDFSCTCPLGFDGNICQNNINDCINVTCTPPLVCHDEINNYTCACETGYGGPNCDVEINECESNPCQNGGTCNDYLGFYNCSCQQSFVNLTKYNNGVKTEFITGFKGKNCEVNIDECSYVPSVCLNNGKCTDNNGGYHCFCGPDGNGIFTTGANCELMTSYCDSAEEVKNDPPACKNGGTCTGGSNAFTCQCAPGFTGRRCETNIDECESNPCRYNGSCIDLVNGYNCSCIPGITGANCEINIDECEPGPCQHGGQCRDLINGYECNCTDTGFNGTNCELNIDDCAPGPCQHGSNCTDLIKDYNCTCYQGYTGKNCETDINECAEKPCQYNGTCLQKSNRTLYEINYPEFDNFSYATAAGYICLCITGITGHNCETNIDDCQHDKCKFGSTCVDLIADYKCHCAPGYRGTHCETEIDECLQYTPCQHGSSCRDEVADYVCKCLEFYNGKQYGGKNCSVELTSCLGNSCTNGATCQPFLINEALNTQDYSCKCQNGFTGQYCGDPTTGSFSGNSKLYFSLPSVENNDIAFRFRTTLPDAILLIWYGKYQTTSMFVNIEIKNGNIFMGYVNGSIQNAKTEYVQIEVPVNDANWHQISLKQSDKLILKLSSDACPSVDACKKEVVYSHTVPLKIIYFGTGNSIFKNGKTLSNTTFVGCMQDVIINTDVIKIPGYSNLVDVQSGCDRREQCNPDPCNARGRCNDYWNRYTCSCYRRYLGSTCLKEFIAATFGFENQKTFVAFPIPSAQKEALRQQVDFSFFLRTRKQNGLVAFIGNSNQTFLTLEVYQGYLACRLLLCNDKAFVPINQTVYANGYQHLVQMKLTANQFSVSINETVYARRTINLVQCSFEAEYLYLGGRVPDGLRNSRRKRRNVNEFVTVNDILDFSNVSDFKGTIQDVQLNNYSLQFYPLNDTDVVTYPTPTTSNLTQGEKSDDICSQGPCQNNGTCVNVFFNDYRCLCPHGFRGKDCGELDFCHDDSCPASATCQSLNDGFECLSEVTLRASVQSYIEYRPVLSPNRNIDQISIQLRTIVKNGLLMYIRHESHSLKLGIVGGNIQVICKLGSGKEEVFELSHDVSNRQWYLVSVKEIESNITLTVKGNNSESSKTFIVKDKVINLKTLITGIGTRTIKFGRISEVDSHSYYSGCLREIRIGGILLPFYYKKDFIKFTTAEYFEVDHMLNTDTGCKGGHGCAYVQCKHGSKCTPDYYGYLCECLPGYNGHWCENNIDDCRPDTCYDHGVCVDGINSTSCNCRRGYSGERCDSVTNSCQPDPCQNNASCVDLIGDYQCNCTGNFTGKDCDVKIWESCDNAPCENNGVCHVTNVTNANGNTYQSFNCTCPPGYTGNLCEVMLDYCLTLPCDNDGTCTTDLSKPNNYTCSCNTGFTGDQCKTNIDDCVDQLCHNNGTCIDLINDHICNCTDGWDGSNCNLDKNECDTQPCQNGGQCNNTRGSYSCDCYGTGYQGFYCETDIDECTLSPPICQNEANCTNYDGSYNCSCTHGYKGDNCSIADCALVGCQNSATCEIISDKWTCNCRQFYYGQLCEYPGPCANQPCHSINSNYCTQFIQNNSYVCTCKSGWTGPTCDTDINECLDSPCKNNATCNNNNGSYSCVCVPGYTGVNCEVNIDECASAPCRNQGKCKDGLNRYTCNCSGTGYVGTMCTEDIDECMQSPCQNNGKCKNLPGKYLCNCASTGYKGDNCDEKDPQFQRLKPDNRIWIIVGPVVAGVLLIIVIGIVIFIMMARSKRATRGTYSPSRQEISGSRVELGNVLKPPPEERLI